MKIAAFCLSLVLSLCFVSGSVRAAPDDPGVPPGLDPGGVAVAQIDTGVNYTLPFISSRLARDGEGDIIGYDFEDDDLTPFDAQPGDHGTSPRRHGTSVAGILLREAPLIRLQPYRYAADKPESFADILYQIGYTQARIVAMPLGGATQSDWEPFRAAAQALPNVLFVISAGNDGKNIDEKPVYPAAFALPNVIVVAATDSFGRFPLSSSFGSATVDISTPAEAIESIDFTGARITVSGSSFAVPRIAALAARILERQSGLDASALKAAVIATAGPNPSEREKRTIHGWIPAPGEIVLDE